MSSTPTDHLKLPTCSLVVIRILSVHNAGQDGVNGAAYGGNRRDALIGGDDGRQRDHGDRERDFNRCNGDPD